MISPGAVQAGLLADYQRSWDRGRLNEALTFLELQKELAIAAAHGSGRAGERGGGKGEAAARNYSARLAALRVRPGQKPPVGVFYQVWDRPLMTVGGTHWISDALALCGARNVFADLQALSPVVSREAVLQRAPALIVSGTDAPDMRRAWQRFTHLPAVRNQAFVRVDADRLHRLTPRLIEGVVELCAAVEPYVR